ncbi:hypothetical protein AALP_AA7G191700 [Arabis alpina]|uniref:Uncharacterized protein n=1 Tax=Arabis alpina TaxID=50452 RepID=A0A087GJ34_ARAAL|nr:hypothetical protein AALP_AA7G191700 [Arabis alpina]
MASPSLIVEKSEVVLVKPSKPTVPDVSLSLSTIDNDPYMAMILRTICVFAPNSYLKDEVLVSHFLHGLSRALVLYYPLAGKIHRKSEDNRLELNCKAGDGVPFIKATAPCTLSSLNYLEGTDHLDASYQLVPCYEPVKGCEEHDPLAVQLTQFACGGMTIGAAYAHAVCDGVGMGQFFRATMELAFGNSQPTVIPVWNRERLTFNNIYDELGKPEVVEFPKACSSIATSPYSMTEDNVVREILNITSADIAKLKNIIIAEEKSKTNEQGQKEVDITTLEILTAHIWRARSRALKLNPEGSVVLRIVAGIRGIMEPPLPEGYYGNAVIAASMTLTARELSEFPLSRVVRLIKDMKTEALDKRYMLGRLSEVETRVKEMTSFDRKNAWLMTLTDWRRIGLHYDGLVNIIPVIPMTMPVYCILLPASKADPEMSGGVRLLVTLPREAMAKFKEEMKNGF